MTSINPRNTQSISYSRRTSERAMRAMRCSPFQLQLFVAMGERGVDLRAIAGNSGMQNQYIRSILSERIAETELLWLIQVGLLRREVDGQGITDSFRLTPLGRQLVKRYQQSGGFYAAPSLWDRLRNALSRWFRLNI